MRLFFAIDLDEPARSAVARRIALLRRRTAGLDASLRWVAPAKLHVTLAFFPEVPPERVGGLCDTCAPSLRQSPFPCCLSVPGVFPARGAPRVVWVGPARGRTELAGLHGLLWQRLADAGWGPAPGAFEPHLTLGRVRQRRGANTRQLRAVVTGTPGPAAEWTINHVSLYESRPSNRGATYHRLALARLDADGPGTRPERQMGHTSGD